MVNRWIQICAALAAIAAVATPSVAQPTQQQATDPEPQARPETPAAPSSDQPRPASGTDEDADTFESFDPSVEISTDNAVSFPTDI